MTIAGEHGCTCAACGRRLASKGHYIAKFRSLFGEVPIRIRRLLICPCQRTGEAKSFAAFGLEAATVAPELAYVTARYAALAPFGKVADLLRSCCQSAGAERGHSAEQDIAGRGRRCAAATAKPTTARPAEPIVVGLDGG